MQGDLITNSARYVQRCEHYRRDVQMVDMAMLTYKWFIPTQGPNFPAFVWPGTHYHPYESDGFSMRGRAPRNTRVHGCLFTLHSYARHVIDRDVNPPVLC